MVTTVWHLQPPRKRGFISKLSSSGTRVKIKKLVQVFHQSVSGHMEISQHAVQTW